MPRVHSNFLRNDPIGRSPEEPSDCQTVSWLIMTVGAFTRGFSFPKKSATNLYFFKINELVCEFSGVLFSRKFHFLTNKF